MNIQRTETASIAQELERLNDAISQRASELYLENRHPSLLDNWLAAEEQLVKRPLVELHEGDRQIEVCVGLDGFDAENIEVRVALQELLIRARAETRSRNGALIAAGDVGADAVGVVHLAEVIDPDSVSAVFQDGQLTLTMSVHAATSA